MAIFGHFDYYVLEVLLEFQRKKHHFNITLRLDVHKQPFGAACEQKAFVKTYNLF
jgi:hypothetical protein